MKKPKYLLLSIILLSAILLGACNLPTGNGNTDDAAATSIAATAEAVFTHAAETAIVSLPSATTAPEITLTATNTLMPTIPPATATNTPIPCNRGSFVKDVTYPDGTEVNAGTAFTKTWRIKNNGSCTWNSSYVLLFDSGDQMGAPATSPITTGTVAPGATIDISVDLVAPSDPKSYQGNFKLRSSDNIVFGINADGQGPFWVKVVVPAPTATPGVPTLPPPVAAADLPLIGASSGMVGSDGAVHSPTNAGDSSTNTGIQGFFTFDTSTLPVGITIDSVSLNVPSHDILGDPFGNLGCLRMYADNYGALDGSDYVTGAVSGALARWCDEVQLTAATDIPEIKNYIQTHLGTSSLQFRIQFNDLETNGDDVGDVVRLGNETSLRVVYH